MVISYSFGIIDFLHYGHIRMFEDARRHSDRHILGLISDEAIYSWHGTLVSSYRERQSVLQGVRYIDEIRPQDSFDPLPNLRSIHREFPDAKIVLYTGNDRNVVPCETFLKEIGGEVRVFEYYEKLSPQNILESLTVKTERKKRYAPGSNLISTKANTLIALKPLLKKGRIEDIHVITVGEWSNGFDASYRKIRELFGGDRIVVRSSSMAEDCFKTSNAGHFESVLDVDSSDRAAVENAVATVARSYDTSSGFYMDEQILVQRQTRDVVCAGVIFTRDIDSNLPYYLINYDDGSSTDSVTSGSRGSMVRILRRAAKKEPPRKWEKLLAVVGELESLLNRMVLDIEFAITSDGGVVIFQVRPLAANYKFQVKRNDEQFYSRYEKEVLAYNNILSYRTSAPMLLSDMAFWNPAEIIGANPHNLDYSLYRDIITRQAWNEGLLPLGYKKVPDDLMFRVGNKPYISLDYSFLALTPAALDEEFRDRLCRYYRKRLLEDPTAHDKIEFEIVFSCLDFSTDKRIERLSDEGFSREEINAFRQTLYGLTDGVLNNYAGILSSDTEDLRELDAIRLETEREEASCGDNVFVTLRNIRRLLSALKKYGTPQFSRQARCAFISRSLCKSMVEEELVPEKDMDLFMSSIRTVAAQFETDFRAFSSGEMSKREFNDRYGHLRCGTYDIRSPRYDRTDFRQDSVRHTACLAKPSVREDLTGIESEMKRQLLGLGFTADGDSMIRFIRTSIEERERFKFEFTKSLSLVLELIEKIGARMDLDAAELSYLEVSDILAAEYYTSMQELKEFWTTLISKRKEIHREKSMLVLPEVIASGRDLEIIVQNESRPNFITTRKAEGETVNLDNNDTKDVQGKIVVITKADPGYDWLFSKGIAGLVTKYGGAASHMAIRCAEFGLPAAIGCGEKIFDYAVKSERIEIDCGNHKITRVC